MYSEVLGVQISNMSFWEDTIQPLVGGFKDRDYWEDWLSLVVGKRRMFAFKHIKSKLPVGSLGDIVIT